MSDYAPAVQVTWLNYLWTGLFFALVAGVLGRFLWHPRWIRQLPAFFAYVLWQFLSSAAFWIVGTGSPWAPLIYHVSDIATAGFEIAVLIQIYYIFKTPEDRSHWFGLALFAAAVGLLAAGEVQGVFLALSTVFFLFECALGILVQVRRVFSSDVRLGRTYNCILFGLTLSIVLQAVNFIWATLEITPWSVYAFLAQPLSLVSWLWYASAMRRVEMPRFPGEQAPATAGIRQGAAAK